MNLKAFILVLFPTVIFANEYNWGYGAKAGWPQIASLSFAYISMGEEISEFRPLFQIEPGLAGNKISVGFGNVSGSQGAVAPKAKVTYLNLWAITDTEWDSKYGYLGTEFEVMLLFPSIHLGLYHPLEKEAGLGNLKISFGMGVML